MTASWLHTLWFVWVTPSMKHNGASMVVGAMLLPLVKRYLNAQIKKGRVRAALMAAWRTLRHGPNPTVTK